VASYTGQQLEETARRGCIMITCHKEMSCHGHVTFATPTVRPDLDETPDDRKLTGFR
jgi:hypothetical protein